MDCANYVGRVGGLAVALGVGIAVATTPAVAWAAPSDDGSTKGSSTSSSESSDNPSSPPDSTESSPASQPSGQSGDTVTGVGTKKSTSALAKDKKSGSDKSAASVAPKRPKRPVAHTPRVSDTDDDKSVANAAASVQPKTEPRPAPEPGPASSVDVAPEPKTLTIASVQETPKVEKAPTTTVQPLESNLLSVVGLAPSAGGDGPAAPVDSPLTLVGLAAMRRQSQKGLVEDAALTKTAAEPSQSSLMMTAAVANSAPTAAPTLSSPDPSTGAVVVALNASDVDGNPLTYGVTGQASGGSVDAMGGGQFRYTPTVAARLAAASTAAPDFDSFTVTVSDGQGGQTPVSITVPQLPAVLANQPSSSNVTGASPYGVAMVGDLAYVANQGTNTVTVVNTKTGAVVGNPITVGRGPTGVLASGGKVYVTNRTDGTVSVIDTVTNKLMDTNPSTTAVDAIKVGSSPEFMAVNDTGTRLFVTNYGSSSVSVIDTTTNKVIDVNPSTTTVDAIKVGAYPRGIAYTTVNGQPRLYVVSRAGNSVSVVDANTYKLIDANPATQTVDSIKVGTTPEMIAIRDGYAYVGNYGSSSVSVINTATNKVEGPAIAVGSKPAGLAFSADGSVLYVANGNDTVSVINTKTRTVVGTVQIDAAPETNYHILAVRSDGSLVATDMSDKALRVVQLNRGNTAPVATANPTVGNADPATGAVSGSVNLKDWDGDPLSYSAVVAPTKGTLTFDPASGTYTYTPTQAAREAAAQTPATDTFTIRATDTFGASTTTAAVTVPISPKAAVNRAPQAGVPSIDSRNIATGAISGLLNFTDPDQNPMTYSVPTQPSSGTVALVGSRYTFTPTQAARDAAAASQGDDTVDITVVASDGQLSTPVTFAVPILPPNPPNQAPVHGTPSADTIVNSTGAVSGSLNFKDPDNDPLTYTVAAQPSSGVVTLSGSTYTFTPTAAARAAAAASNGQDLATITVAASDGQASDTVTFTVPIMQSAKATNQAPFVPGSTIARTIDPVSGTVTGYVNVQDADGDTLIYTLASPPAQGGTVRFDQRSGYFTYTPSQAARAQAAQTSGLDYDNFAVSVTDGTATVSTTVKVQIAAALPPTSTTTNNAVSVGAGPSGVVVLRNNNSYVVNYDSNTVSVIDTATNQVVKTIDVGSGPLGITAVDTTARQRVYVTNSLSNTVSVIDPTTNTVVGTINVPVQDGSYYDGYYDYTFTYPNQVAEVAASSNRLYVNATDGTISVFDTTNDANTLVRTDSLGLYSDLKLSADGSRLYGTRGGTLAVINTATMTASSVTVGPVFTGDGSYQEFTNSVGTVALSPDGKRAYVTYGVTIAERGVGGQPYGSFFTDSTGSNWMITGGYSAVAVIDTDSTSATYNKQIGRILVPLGAQDLAVSGNNLYVANSDNMTVTVIDRTTNMPVSSFSTDQTTGGRNPIEILPGYWVGYVPSNARYITVGGNGAVYVTDYADGTMYAVTIGNPAV